MPKKKGAKVKKVQKKVAVKKNIKKASKKPKKVLVRKVVRHIKRKLGANKKKKSIKKQTSIRSIVKKKKVVTIKKVHKPKKLRKAQKRVQKPKSVRRVARNVLAIKSKKQEAVPQTDTLAQSFFKPKIRVIGIGGGGSAIVSEIGRSLDKASFVAADTDTRNFKNRKGIKSLVFGQKITHGLGTGLNPFLGKLAAEHDKEKLATLFEDQDMVVFVISLGGGVGSGAGPVFAELSQKFPGISLGIFTLPFKFEGKSKYKIATKALAQLRESLNVSITIANERIFRVIDANTAITQAFSMVNKNLIESLESLIDLIYNPGIINIDFADLKATLGEKGSLAFLNTTEASGKDRLEKIKKTLLHNYLYANDHFKVQRILFNISGDKDLSMLEVDKISKIVSEQNPKAKIIFGISRNQKYKNKIKATILMTGPNPKERVQISTKATKKSTRGTVIILKNTKGSKKPRGSQRKKEEVIVMPPLNGTLNRVPIAVSSTVRATPPEVVLSTQHHKVLSKKEKVATIRRTALEIKKAQEIKETEQSQQEKEWEIPTFLRKIKFKQ